MNFFHSDASGGGATSQLHRLLELVHVPSRFVGTQTQCNPFLAAATAGSHQFGPPFNWISNYREPGRITLITRFGKDGIHKHLPPLVRIARAVGLKVVWSCDPMHGNTTEQNGLKTRDFNAILAELEAAFEVRREVFVREQGYTEEQEFDEAKGRALHALVMLVPGCATTPGAGRGLGTARLLVDNTTDPPVAFVSRVSVLPHARRMGVGRALVTFLLDAARQLGCPRARAGAPS